MPKLLQSKIAALSMVLLLGLMVLPLWVPTAIAQLTPNTSTLLNNERPRPLAIAEAFPFFVSINSPEALQVSWQIADGHYLYRQQFDFALKLNNEAQATAVAFTLPDGLKKNDEFFGDIEAYYEGVTATLNLNTTQLDSAVLVIQYQGCADWGFCYPPQIAEFPFNP
jgi:thiol:disulfide interchange protein DsbD